MVLVITDFIVSGFLGFIRTLTDLIPAFNLPQPETDGTVFGALGSLNAMAPLSAILLATIAALALRLGLVAWDAIVWIYHQFWGSS